MKKRKYIDEIYISSSPEPLDQFQSKLQGIQVCSNEGPPIFQGETITKSQKYIDETLKSSPELLGQF